ncbi:UPF0029-domain-containing protein [Lindgomyces ingoldianus]|uniref:UPF0029-domain-containing protein n=1 Tax=Lindgomyces ingoldianus TaxID=673940 RepID=A0ACB6Q7J5_9PLEO|nr:UPF0029-domain-containing protein [Lindgomyces ingoldianus]KAF2462780.1 UPF0029-domain-containing protein [Lindgomyces ingoldianus]
MTFSLNDAINDEITSINSIFDLDTLSSISEDASICSLRLPSLPSIVLRLKFPLDYPDTPPLILGTQTVGEDVQKGVGKQIVDIVRDVLTQVYRPGEACIFDLLEEVRDALEKAEEKGTLHIQDHIGGEGKETDESIPDASMRQDISSVNLGPEPPWIIAPPITEKKSIFLARVAPVYSPAQAKSYVAHLLATDKKAARATHNITAWRIRGLNDTSYQDCDDDGETAAGGRILHLMQLMDVWDVMVIVTRWYGGVLLGPDRFRIINTTAREALVLGGFAREGKEGSGEGKKKGRK